MDIAEIDTVTSAGKRADEMVGEQRSSAVEEGAQRGEAGEALVQPRADVTRPEAQQIAAAGRVGSDHGEHAAGAAIDFEGSAADEAGAAPPPRELGVKRMSAELS